MHYVSKEINIRPMKATPISELKVGMYVESILKCQTNFVLKKPGFVTSQASINKLKQSGVLLVNIDPSKNRSEAPSTADPKPPAEAESATPLNRYDAPTVPFESELVEAKALYSQVRSLQKRTLEGLQSGQALNLDAFKGVSTGLIDSIFRNSQALTMLTRIRTKDEYLLEHSLSVGILLGVFAHYLKLDEAIIADIVLGGLIHDLGKMKIPDQVLHKPSRLTPSEFEIMKGHVLHGRDIIRDAKVEVPLISLQIMLHHHETLNRTGYPNRIGANDLSLYCRMASIVDIFDALTAERVYKKAMLPTAAFSIIRSMAPDKLDDELVGKFIRCINIYPLGTLVRLKSDRLGIVYELNKKSITKPIVKLIYHARHQRHINVELLNLALPSANDDIVSAEKPEVHGLNLENYL